MRYIAAYLLLQIGGNASPSAADIKKVLGAGGIDVEEERLEKFLAEVKGKSIDELIAAGSSKLASVWNSLVLEIWVTKYIITGSLWRSCCSFRRFCSYGRR